MSGDAGTGNGRRFDDHVAARAVAVRASRYRSPLHARQFRQQVMNPPTYTAEGPDGTLLLLRRTGSGVYYPYWHGYDGVGRPLPPATQGGVAYAAGRFRRELEEKGRLPRLPALKVDPMTGRLVKGQVMAVEPTEPTVQGPAPQNR